MFALGRLGGFEALQTFDWAVAFWLERDFRIVAADGAHSRVHLARALHGLAFCAGTFPAARRLVIPAFLLVEGLIALGRDGWLPVVATRKLNIRHTLLKLTCLLRSLTLQAKGASATMVNG